MERQVQRQYQTIDEELDALLNSQGPGDTTRGDVLLEVYSSIGFDLERECLDKIVVVIEKLHQEGAIGKGTAEDVIALATERLNENLGFPIRDLTIEAVREASEGHLEIALAAATVIIDFKQSDKSPDLSKATF